MIVQIEKHLWYMKMMGQYITLYNPCGALLHHYKCPMLNSSYCTQQQYPQAGYTYQHGQVHYA